MSKTKGNLVEQHIDKIVLGVIGLLSVYLIWSMVISNPYGNQSPSQIDRANQSRAEELNRQLEGPSVYTPPPSQNQLARYENLMERPFEVAAVSWDLPGSPREVIDGDRRYPVPEIVALSDVKVQPIRGAAYLPLEEVRPDMPYDVVGTELRDLDMVTVSARVDLQSLYRNFQQSFMGPRLKATWKSNEYATPVFARVELQRRRLLADGTWSDWQMVPRPKTDPYRRQIDEIPLQIDPAQSSGSLSLLTAQFRDPSKQIQVLQPRAYDFATWKVPYWIPPEYYKEYVDRLQRLEDERRREMRNLNQPGGAGGMEGAGGRRGNTRGGREMQPTPGRGNTRDPQRGGFGGEMAGGIVEADTRRGTRTPTPDEVLRDAMKDIMDSRTNLWNLSNALVWAHDDTAAPGNTYQYRMRLGVFNPIAGKSWFSPEQQEYQNQVVLLGDYSEPTSDVTIPRMLQVFPTEAIAEQPGALEVEVARYFMGKWQSHEFTVYPGQNVGDKVEEETPSVEQAGGMAPMGRGMEMGMEGGMAPMGAVGAATAQTVDYSTGLVYLDTMPMVEWSEPPIRQQKYQVMMYTGGDAVIANLPIGNRNWPREMQSEYTSIKSEERDAANLVLKPRPSSASGMMGPGTMPVPGRTPVPGEMPMPGVVPGGRGRGFMGEGGLMIE